MARAMVTPSFTIWGTSAGNGHPPGQVIKERQKPLHQNHQSDSIKVWILTNHWIIGNHIHHSSILQCIHIFINPRHLQQTCLCLDLQPNSSKGSRVPFCFWIWKQYIYNMYIMYVCMSLYISICLSLYTYVYICMYCIAPSNGKTTHPHSSTHSTIHHFHPLPSISPPKFAWNDSRWSTTLRPFGPKVTFTAFATALIPPCSLGGSWSDQTNQQALGTADHI